MQHVNQLADVKTIQSCAFAAPHKPTATDLAGFGGAVCRAGPGVVHVQA